MRHQISHPSTLLALLQKMLLMPFLLSLLSPQALHAAADTHSLYRQMSTVSTSAVMDQAKHYQDKGCQDSAVICYVVVADRMEQATSRTEQLQCISALSSLGYYYAFAYYDYPKAYTYLRSAIQWAERLHAESELPRAYMNMANLSEVSALVFSDSSKQLRPIDLNLKAMDVAYRARQWRYYVSCMNNVVNYAYGMNRMGRIKGAIARFVKAPIPQATPLAAFTRYHCLTLQAADRGNLPEAMRYTDSMLVAVPLQGKPTAEAARCNYAVWSYRIAFLKAMGRQGETAVCIAQMKRLAELTGTRDFKQMAYADLGNYYRESGDSTRASHYELLALRLKNEMINESKLQSLSEMDFLRDLDAAHSQMQQMRQHIALQRRTLFAVGIIALLILIFAIVITILYRQLNRKNRSLYATSVQRMALEQENDTLRLQAEKEHAKYSDNPIDEDEKERLYRSILQVLSEPSTVCSPSFTLTDLTQRVESKQRYVSQVINEKSGKNFSRLVGEYRIREACKMINDTAHTQRYTLEAIATETGFGSRSSFNSTFKRYTGLTPTEYMRIAREK